MLCINDIINVPQFISRYMLKEPNIELLRYTHDFCSDLLEQSRHSYFVVNNKVTYIHIPITNKSMKFLKFYFKKSKLDHRYNCKYEDELGLAKSTDNECFEFKFEDTDNILNGILKDYTDEEVIIELFYKGKIME